MPELFQPKRKGSTKVSNKLELNLNKTSSSKVESRDWVVRGSSPIREAIRAAKPKIEERVFMPNTFENVNMENILHPVQEDGCSLTYKLSLLWDIEKKHITDQSGGYSQKDMEYICKFLHAPQEQINQERKEIHNQLNSI